MKVILVWPALAGGCHIPESTNSGRDSSLKDWYRPQGSCI